MLSLIIHLIPASLIYDSNLRLPERFGIRNFLSIKPISGMKDRFFTIFLLIVHPFHILLIPYLAGGAVTPENAILFIGSVNILIKITYFQGIVFRIGHQATELDTQYCSGRNVAILRIVSIMSGIIFLQFVCLSVILQLQAIAKNIPVIRRINQVIAIPVHDSYLYIRRNEIIQYQFFTLSFLA